MLIWKEKLKQMYVKGLITKEDLDDFEKKGLITSEEKEELLAYFKKIDTVRRG